MSSFRHVPGGIIFFDDYAIPLSFFITQEVDYALPEGMIEQRYIQGVSYIASDGVTEKRFDIPNEDMEYYISKKDDYIAAYELYIDTPQDVPAAKLIKQNELDAKYSSVIKGGIIFNGNVFPSEPSKYLNELLFFTRMGDVPTGYGIRNNELVLIPMTLEDLENLTNAVQMLAYLGRVNYEAHLVNLGELDTIETVLAYDITTGWPTTPYEYPA